MIYHLDAMEVQERAHDYEHNCTYPHQDTLIDCYYCHVPHPLYARAYAIMFVT